MCLRQPEPRTIAKHPDPRVFYRLLKTKNTNFKMYEILDQKHIFGSILAPLKVVEKNLVPTLLTFFSDCCPKNITYFDQS